MLMLFRKMRRTTKTLADTTEVSRSLVASGWSSGELEMAEGWRFVHGLHRSNVGGREMSKHYGYQHLSSSPCIALAQPDLSPAPAPSRPMIEAAQARHSDGESVL